MILIRGIRDTVTEISILVDDVDKAPVDDKQEPDGQNDGDDEASQWVRELKHKGRKVFSQNDEDGALEAVFDYNIFPVQVV